MSYDDKRKRPPEEPLDYSPSSGPVGSHAKEYELTAPHSNDGRSKTVTKFYDNGEGESIDYDKLAKINDGMYSDKSDKRRRRAERRRDMDVFTDVCNFPSHSRDRAHHILDNIEDVRRHESDETLLLAIISLVANENERMIRQEDSFQSICESCSVTRKQIRNSRKKLRDKL